MSKSPVLITGVGRRIGLALALDCLAKGYHVIGTYRTSYPELVKLKDMGAELYQCDFQYPEQVSQLIDAVSAKHTSLRAIIHNASDWLPDSKNREDDLSTIQQMMNVHVNIPYHLNLALEPLLRAYPDGIADIIHITDYVAATGSKKHIAYAASKAAAENLVLSYAAKLAPEVTVNSIAPALIIFNAQDTQAYKEKALSKSVMAREGGAQEILRAIHYLLQSEYMTGRSIELDGGRHLK